MKEGVEKILSSKNKMLLAFCFCFIVGAGSFSFLEDRRCLFYVYIFLFVILCLLVVCWQKKICQFVCFCLLAFVAGAARFLVSIPDHNASRVEFYNGSKKVVHGFVSEEPDRRISEARYVVRVEKITDGKDSTLVQGNMLVKTLLYPAYDYGDSLKIECVLQQPKNAEDSTFNYVKYLAKQDIWSVCVNPKVELLEGGKGNFLVKIMLGVKNSIQLHMSRLWPEPDSSLIAGILYGSRSGLPDDVTVNFSRTGVSHIVAVSGYNVTIIILALHALLIYVGFFRRQSFWLLVLLIIVFVFFTGASASVVRAGLMALLVLLSQHIGRISAIDRVLVYAALVMLVVNPYLLVWDAGFQLSFLATIGLVYISPILQRFFEKKFKIKNAIIVGVVEIFLNTISAIIATLPLILYQFGRFSVSAPLVNMLILWLIPLLMLVAFSALVLSFIFFPLGQFVAWFAWLGTRYVILVVDWFGNQSWSAVDLYIPGWTMIIMYAILILLVVKNKYRVEKIYVQEDKSSLI